VAVPSVASDTFAPLSRRETNVTIEDTRTRLILLVAAAVVALALLWSAAESHYRSCVTAAQARFPATPVSAASGRETGPLKLSFVEERQDAVDDCSRLPL
jgi:hypothetical protein